MKRELRFQSSLSSFALTMMSNHVKVPTPPETFFGCFIQQLSACASNSRLSLMVKLQLVLIFNEPKISHLYIHKPSWETAGS